MVDLHVLGEWLQVRLTIGDLVEWILQLCVSGCLWHMQCCNVVDIIRVLNIMWVVETCELCEWYACGLE